MSSNKFNTQVIKLGGSSQTLTGYKTLVEKLNNDLKTVIVVSAIKGITNNLITLINKIRKDEKDKSIFLEEKIINVNSDLVRQLDLDLSFLEEDYNFLRLIINSSYLNLKDETKIVSMGETFTAKILNQYLLKYDHLTEFFDAVNFIKCNQKNLTLHNNGNFSVEKDIILDKLANKDMVVIPGFRGINSDEEICLMGRGGSDTTGSIIASELQSIKYQIWTDVSGIYSGDPNKMKNVHIIESISYDAAQEISAMGAKVIHPYCIQPCKKYNIPIEIRNTYNFDTKFTTIGNIDELSEKTIYSITNQEKNCIFKIESLNMWNNYGFVYDIFSKFKKYNVDVNIINTSQFDITTTTNDTDMKKLLLLKEELEKLYKVELVPNCNLISIVGENIKKFTKLNLVMNSILEFDIKLTSYSSNDMTLSFVIEEDFSNKLSEKIHNIIFPFNQFEIPKDIWWKELLENEGPDNCQYLYNLDVVNSKINDLKNLTSIDKIYYAMKANNNTDIIKNIINQQLGFETVSIDEIHHLESITNDLKLDNKIDILYTPNFAKVEDYLAIFLISENQKFNIKVILDNLDVIKEYPEVFKDKKIALRLDLDYGFGHCNKVITQGQDSKFGIMPDDIINNFKLLDDLNISIIGLHSHMGSGISNYKHWVNNLNLIISIYKRIPDSINKIEWFDIGGGFGIDNVIDFNSLNKEISMIKKDISDMKIFIEPGRFIVAEAGIIWGKVTQTKFKNNTKFIGTNIGMTDLLRPALYSAIHPTYFKESNEEKELATIVGPICESGDILVKNLLVNKSIKINDSIIISNSGAYGIVMASSYNNRKLPDQIIM